MTRPRRRLLALALLLVGVGVGVVLWLALRSPFSVERVRDTVVTTLMAEAPASDLVTGRVGVAARREIRDRGRFAWVPGWLDLPGINLLDASARVEVRGEALYGFDVRRLRPEMITVHPDGLVEVELPELHVVAVDSDLGQLRVRTSEGELRAGAADRLQDEALRDVRAALHEQAQRHLETSVQPAVNTAQALRAMLDAPLRAAGVEEPRFRFHIGPDLTLEPPPEAPAAPPG
ncbi:MAG: DUF4230 domain-containing protein [Rhodothermales bacterium]|nr:DUF4230 domain-containing protein [Rhodothermales bacterium]